MTRFRILCGTDVSVPYCKVYPSPKGGFSEGLSANEWLSSNCVFEIKPLLNFISFIQLYKSYGRELFSVKQVHFIVK